MSRALKHLAWLGLVVACGSSEKPAPKSAAEGNDEGSERRGSSTIEASAEIGALDEGKVDKIFNKSLRDLQACLDSGAKRVEFLGGGVAFFIKVDPNGKVAHAHLEQTSIGDRQTEKCMLDALKKKDWPPPQGGQVGLARKSFEFDPPNDVRPPTEWGSDRVSSALGKASDDIKKCKGDAPGSYAATMYVDTSGQVLGIGIAPPDERGEEAVDCLVDVVRGIKFPSPGSWPAKVTFSL